MIAKSKLAILVLSALFFSATSAAALGLGQNITIYDGLGSGSGWHGTQEDQEVEPPDVTGQEWDLEGFFLKGSKLTLVGGFDFVSGEEGYQSGDIFIDTDGKLVGGTTDGSRGNTTVDNTFGYEYVLDMDFAHYTYNVLKLDKNASVLTVYYGENGPSNPWRYESGGTLLENHVPFSYYSGLSNQDVAGLQGGTHNAFTVDLGFLSGLIPGKQFISHFTIGCGNDNVMGAGPVRVPESSTILLSFIGLLGICSFLYKRIS